MRSKQLLCVEHLALCLLRGRFVTRTLIIVTTFLTTDRFFDVHFADEDSAFGAQQSALVLHDAVTNNPQVQVVDKHRSLFLACVTY